MGFLSNILGQLFKYIYETVESLGIGGANVSNYAVAVIIMGLIYKLLTIPMTIQSAKQSKRQQELQPELDRIKRKYGYDQQIYQQKMQEFQKENNMMQGCGSTCLTFILQMIIVIALYGVMREPHKYLPGFENISRNFFWINDLSLADPTGYLLPLINSLSQLGYQYFNRTNMQQQSQNGMQTVMYIMPIMFFFIFRTLPAGLVLYWSVGNVIEIIVKGIIKLSSRPRVRSQE